MSESSWFDSYLVCMNGHGINDSHEDAPQYSTACCEKCGARTIAACEHCGASVKGREKSVHYLSDGYATPTPPKYCHRCGSPYPWTEARLRAAHELADELSDLCEEERETLKKSLDELVSDTPQTTLAATKFKRLMTKAGSGIADGFKTIMVDIVSETAKKMLWPS